MNASFEFQKDEKSIQGSSTELPLFSTSFFFNVHQHSTVGWVGNSSYTTFLRWIALPTSATSQI